ncbi:MAG: ATP-binding cassette domain-containing protein [Acidimicrobiales bacterium]
MTEVLRSADLELERGTTTSLVGASGSGKSTLLGLLAGIVAADAGQVLFDGVDLAAIDDAARARLRGSRIGVVLQRGNLIPFLTARENVELALRLGGRRRAGGRARSLLGDLGLSSREDHLPRRLSGGEAQRAGLAVALANEPDLLLADEVTGELDDQSAEQVLGVINRASEERGLTVLFVTHSSELAARAGRRLRLMDGAVQAK